MTDVERRVVMKAQRFGRMRRICTTKTLHKTVTTTVHRESVFHDDLRVGSGAWTMRCGGK